MILAQDHPVSDQDRRTAGAEVVLERPHRPLPEELAGAVVAEEAARAEEADDAFAVGDGSGLGVAADLVNLLQRRAGRRHFPENLAVRGGPARRLSASCRGPR